MYYYVYQIVNKTSGKIYVGVHKTNNLDDGYMGSGKYLRRAIKKEGIENFEKTILEFFENAENMFNREAEIVTLDFLSKANTYNLIKGGSLHGAEHASEIGRIGGKRCKEKGVGIFSKEVREYIYSKEVRERTLSYMRDNKIGICFNVELRQQMIERSNTPAAKEKKRETYKNIKHQQGEKNSQFGTVWINNGSINKKIKKVDEVPDGWARGRKIPLDRDNPASKAVICLETLDIFPSMSEASNKYFGEGGRYRGRVQRSIKKGKPEFGYTWMLLSDYENNKST